MLAAILAVVFVAGEDVPAVKFDLVSRQAVVEEQPDDSRHGDMEIHRRYPILPIRLEITPELAHFAPAIEIVIGISTLLERDDLGEVAEKQGKRPSGADYADRHIMLVQHQDVTVQTRLIFSGNHSSYTVRRTYSRITRWCIGELYNFCRHAFSNVRRLTILLSLRTKSGR